MTQPDDPIDRDAIKAHYIAERGYWRPWTEALLRDNPNFLERYATYAGHPARVGPLPQKMVELIYVALDSSSTHLFGGGLKTHMEKALALGARSAEILDVLIWWRPRAWTASTRQCRSLRRRPTAPGRRTCVART